MAGFRIERVNKELQREISRLLEFSVKDENAKRAVITGVDCAKDLKSAKVYFTTISPEDRRSVSESLKKVRTFLRSSLAQSLRIRTVPELRFIYDTSGEYGRSIDRLLDMVVTHEENTDYVEGDDGERE
ncbi:MULTISPECIES: 30S ribosome-binding factor RbfA [Dethiosulfovibrio]|jgi:ribosome-binding factor A|uniref:Ribosome-binding factor A n=2 Tax=Dethiosulfovibrio TaxID=47054 RepID=A0ABS9ELJ8_9BACT|nr:MULTISPECIES: 30S ribosome-binding factor RbfA [Dethiosulfovibrio]MCF4113603.1 30S ribosome-binding factor RbfA [Dethiosulfovibrio russensis]MCF4142073.1 30S ribosome-binding factor RbfA [Dethiosulfovibrio marinus]MCF4144228.1 30S ribosome-binding factor RbfA [Dethiosulfovibrio acidaminovorans]MEA3283428.1 30S ribosome-binding factor RbfA [Synergistota bacterium]